MSQKVVKVLIMLLFFALPIKRELLPPLIVITLIFSFFTRDIKSNLKMSLGNLSNLIPAFLIVLLFILYSISILYSKNISQSFANIQVKMSLIVFPFLFIISPPLTKKDYHHFTYSFLLGVLVAVFITVLNAFISAGSFTFEYTYFQHYHHTYFALMLNMAISIVLFNIYKDNANFRYLNRNILYVFLILFSFMVFLIGSRTGIISFVMISVYFSVLLVKKNLQSFTFPILFIIAFIFIAGFWVLRNNDYIKETISSSKELSINKSATESETSSSLIRMAIWNSALHANYNLISGVGIGDADSVLKDQYLIDGNVRSYSKSYNSHNQYIQTLIEIGVFGLLLLITLLGYLFVFSYRMKNHLLLAFTFLVSVSFLFEVMLNRLLGVVFISLFLMVFTMNSFKDEDSIKKDM